MSRWRWAIAALFVIASCGTRGLPPASTVPAEADRAVDCAPTTPHKATPDPTRTSVPGVTERSESLSEEQVATLESLARVDVYPLYTMHYHGSYEEERISLDQFLKPAAAGHTPWACSLFAVLGDAQSLHLSRNFDWEFSPALLLFTDPPDGYAAVSMVNLAFLGLQPDQSHSLLELPLLERRVLLDAPLLPIDGMNEHGLAVGMAAVEPGHMQADPAKDTVGSLGVIRQMLDHAQNVNEAVAILGSYNIDFTGGPPIHYLLADRSGRSMLVEFHEGEMVTLPSEGSWHLATNFLLAAVGKSADGVCRRYDQIKERLLETDGRLSLEASMELLAQVAQPGTQWSIVYGISTGDIKAVMGQAYDRPHLFSLNQGEAHR